VLALLAVLADDAAAQDDAGKIVTVGAKGYSVDAAETNIVQVLTEVGRHAGFSVEAPDSFHSPLTLSLQDVPLDQVLRRVLRHENYIIVYRGGVQKTAISGEKIDKIFLLSSASGQAAKPAGAAGASPLAGPGAPGQRPGQPARNAPPPPPPPPNEEEGGDVATRAARARARAEARRTALGDAAPPGAPGAAPAMPDAASMVQSAEDFTPPSIDEPASPGHGDVPAVDVPPGFNEGDDGAVPDDY